MNYFRNNQAMVVVREDNEGNRFIKQWDETMHRVTKETLVPTDSIIAFGAVGIGNKYPLTEISQGWYDDFGITWRYDKRNGFPVLLLDRNSYSQEMIDHNCALDDIYNGGEPFDDICEVLGDI
ncbi:MAG: hypothetical protein IJ562_03840 [Prevotella sp.]|nr:hypothetical protein [Prevotella sp.]